MSEENIIDPLAIQPVFAEGTKVYLRDGIAHLVFYSKTPEDDRYNCINARLIIPLNRLPNIVAALAEAGRASKAPTHSEDGARLN